MRFSCLRYPAEFQIPDDWWNDAGMYGFIPHDMSYVSLDPAVQMIRLCEIEPPFRCPKYPMDFAGFDRERLVKILSGFVAGDSIPPVPLFALVAREFQPTPFRYRIGNGFHRFYASVAAGFSSLPAIVFPCE